MLKLMLIAVGGAAGAVLRYGVGGLVHRLLGPTFPWGTLVVNLSGSFLIGLLWAVTERVPVRPELSAFLFLGVLGAFTTFSTYSLESFHLLRDGEIRLGLTNILASNLGGLALVVLGFFAARGVFSLLS